MRIKTWLVRIGLSLIALSVAAALVIELPAHWQVRRVEPPLPTLAQLRELRRANGPIAIRYLNTSEQATPVGTLTHSVFIVEWANGELFMIDSAMSEAGAARFGKLVERMGEAEPVRVHGTVASMLGEEIQRVQGVGYTHLHIDHAEGTSDFCKARGPGPMLLQTSWQATQHNFNTREGAAMVRDSCLQAGQLSDGVIQTSPRFPGLGIIAAGGHTPDSTLFAVAVGSEIYLLSGDTTNSKKDIDDDIPKSLLYSYVLVPEHVQRTALLRRWLKSLDRETDVRVLVSHDLADLRASGIATMGANVGAN